MRFAPQRRALFRHLNVKKWSEPLVLWHSWLGNVLRTTTACTFSTSRLPKLVWDRKFLTLLTCKCASPHNGVSFSTSQLPKVVRSWRALYILTWKCASRHNGVQFFISHLASQRWRIFFIGLIAQFTFSAHSHKCLCPNSAGKSSIQNLQVSSICLGGSTCSPFNTVQAVLESLSMKRIP